jgi:predicted ester cyclase
MSIQENKDLIRRYAKEVYNKQNLESLNEFVSADIPDGSVEHLQQFFTAFPDTQAIIEDLIGEGDKVVARLLVSGTNNGPFAGQPPTGKKVQFRSIRVYRIADNKIVQSWAMQDRLGLMEQLGFVRAAGDVNWGAGDEQ